jgi:hypothetical protein
LNELGAPRFSFICCFGGNFNAAMANKENQIPGSMTAQMRVGKDSWVKYFAEIIVEIEKIIKQRGNTPTVINLYFAPDELREGLAKDDFPNNSKQFRNWK